MRKTDMTTKRKDANFAKNFNLLVTQYCTEHGMSREEFAKLVKVPKGSLSLYCSGQRTPKRETQERLAEFFGTDVATLESEGKSSNPQSEVIAIPLYSDLSSKEVKGFFYRYNDWSTRPQRNHFFALALDTLEDWTVPQVNDVLICKPARTVKPNKVLVFEFDGKLYIRRFRRLQNQNQFLDTNDKRPPLVLTDEELQRVAVKGVVLELIRRF